VPRVLLLATTTGYQTRAFGDAAERLGVDLVYATDRCNVLDDPWRDQALPIRFYDELGSAATILDSAAKSPIDDVLVVGDRPTVIAARVLEGLGLPGHPPIAAMIARNKLHSRERLRDAGLPVPLFVPAHISADPHALAEDFAFPCVVKPLELSGSRGVMRVDSRSELVAAFYRLRALLQAPDVRAERSDAADMALIEGFIPGSEFALEGVMSHGTLHVLAIFDKPDPLDGPFFEETVYVTPTTAPPETARAIVDAVVQAARAVGLRHGPIHAECRVSHSAGLAARGATPSAFERRCIPSGRVAPPSNTPGMLGRRASPAGRIDALDATMDLHHGLLGPARVFVLEVAARPIGGLCARALRFASRNDPARPMISLEDLLLRHALGESSREWEREAAASGVMMIPIPRRGVFRRVAGLDEARRVPGVDDVRITAKADQVLVPLPEGASYLGFIFAHASGTEAVTDALREAHARLAFTIDPEVPVLQSHHG
jgi:hypothetical protein